MLDACEHAAPVPTVQSLVNDPSYLDVNAIAGDDLVVHPTEQVEDLRCVSRIRR
jgi:hypothetical protein